MAIEYRDWELTERLIRAVFDSNVYVAAYLSKNPRSPNKEFNLLFSQAILEEVIEKFDQRGIDQALTVELVAFLLADAETIVTSDEKLPALIVDDPDDDLILACAMAGNADYLVTYDPHFDCLGGEFRGIRVLDGLHFLYVVRGDTKPA